MYEDVIDPELEICDPHHHLWDLPEDGGSPLLASLPSRRYLLPELLADIGGGHNVTRTVFVEARAFYREDGPPELASVGETEFVNGVAAMCASGRYGSVRACDGIVAKADLTAGAHVDALLAAHARAGGARFKGIRHTGARDVSGSVPTSAVVPPAGLYLQPAFRAGFARLAAFDLTFDAWLYHPQIPDLVDLARAFPEQPIVLDHVGTPIGIGAYDGRRDEIFEEWRTLMRTLASCPNIWVKLGGLGMSMLGFDPIDKDTVASATLATCWRPYIETCIELFGVERCMFESNFPVDAYSCTYAILWNAFKHIAAGCSTGEKTRLFYGSAAEFYRLPTI